MIDLVAIGHVTFDETPSGVRPGGSAYYAALTARRLGLSVGLLTSVSPDYPLDVFPEGIQVTMVAVTAHDALPARPGQGRADPDPPLPRGRSRGWSTCPPRWREAPLAVLCPVAGEVDPALAGAFDDAAVAVLPQGWMRKRGRGGLMGPQPWEDADDVLPRTQLLVLSEEDLPGGDARRRRVAPAGAAGRHHAREARGDALRQRRSLPRRGRRGDGGRPDGRGRRLRDHAPDRVSACRRRVGGGGRGGLRGSGLGRSRGPAAILDRPGLDARLAAYRRRRGG